jgi:hypothetical protein
VLTHSFVKTDIFVGCAKKERKKHVAKRLIFDIGHTKSHFFFLKPFRGHIGHGDVYTIILFEFMTSSYILKMHII